MNFDGHETVDSEHGAEALFQEMFHLLIGSAWDEKGSEQFFKSNPQFVMPKKFTGIPRKLLRLKFNVNALKPHYKRFLGKNFMSQFVDLDEHERCITCRRNPVFANKYMLLTDLPRIHWHPEYPNIESVSSGEYSGSHIYTVTAPRGLDSLEHLRVPEKPRDQNQFFSRRKQEFIAPATMHTKLQDRLDFFTYHLDPEDEDGFLDNEREKRILKDIVNILKGVEGMAGGFAEDKLFFTDDEKVLMSKDEYAPDTIRRVYKNKSSSDPYPPRRVVDKTVDLGTRERLKHLKKLSNTTWNVVLVPEHLDAARQDELCQQFLDDYARNDQLPPMKAFSESAHVDIRYIVGFDTEGRRSEPCLDASGTWVIGNNISVVICTLCGVLVLCMPLGRNKLPDCILRFLYRKDIAFVGSRIQNDFKLFDETSEVLPNFIDSQSLQLDQYIGLHNMLCKFFNICPTMWKCDHNKAFQYWNIVNPMCDRREPCTIDHGTLSIHRRSIDQLDLAGTRKWHLMSEVLSFVGKHKYQMLPLLPMYYAHAAVSSLYVGVACICYESVQEEHQSNSYV